MAAETIAQARAAKPWYKILYVQVLIAILLGIVVGWLWPNLATNDWIKALGDGFIKLIKMVIAPIIFCTVVSGISHIQDARKVGRVGVKALVYFEVVSSFALIIGLVVGNMVQVGHGLGAKPDAAAVATYVKQAEAQKSVDFVLNIIPDSVVGALARGDILQVLLFAILFGFALMALGERGHRLRDVIDDTAHAVFGVIAIVMKAAPIGAFGAMAYTIGKFVPAALGNLVGLIAVFYMTAALFVFVVLGLIARFVGFSIFKFIIYIRDELLIVLGTSSSESALPQLMEKLERLGCSKPVVGLVVPTGYSFNLDGTNIYMTLATLFIAEATPGDQYPNRQSRRLVAARRHAGRWQAQEIGGHDRTHQRFGGGRAFGRCRIEAMLERQLRPGWRQQQWPFGHEHRPRPRNAVAIDHQLRIRRGVSQWRHVLVEMVEEDVRFSTHHRRQQSQH